ncbi:major capsid protein [Corynebacterium sp. S7]
MPFYPGRADYNNGVISVDEALNSPTVIADRIAEIASKNLLVETIFSNDSTPVEGGAVIFSKTTEKNFYTDNDVTARQPGDEYSVVYRERPAAELARVEDYGGKFATSDEARNRNSNVDFDNDVTALANTITRKLNQRAMETVKAAVDSNETNNLAVIGANKGWGNLNLVGDPTLITPSADRPTAALADVFALAEQQDMGITYTKMIVSPMTKAQIRTAYGTDLNDMLDSFGLELISSNYADDETTYLVDPGKAGFVKYEEPLTVNTWRDEEHRQTWTQGYAMPVMGITLPSAIAAITFHEYEL